MKCATHPDVETNLGCGRCGKPICPKCMVQTPVGARCRECARLYRLPTYQVSGKYYLRAVGAGVGLAAVFGVAWWLVETLVPIFYLGFLIAGGVGYGVGELLSRSVNRKRATGLAVIAGATVTLAYLVGVAIRAGFPIVPFFPQALLFDLLAVALAVFFAVRNFLTR